MTWQNIISLIVFPIVWMIIRDMLAFKREVYTKYVRKEDCIHFRGQKDKYQDELFSKIDKTNNLLAMHIGEHRGKEKNKHGGS